MERLTAWNNGYAYFPECFKDPCNGCGCAKENCDFLESVCRRLAEYEDTDHTPSMIRSLKRSEVNAHKTAIQNAMKLADYEKIGTLEEVREAVEKEKAKKPIAGADVMLGRDDEGNPIWETDYMCAECGMGIAEEYVCCPYCGQAIDWSDVK